MPDDHLLPAALAEALADVVADLRRQWQRELRAIAAEARAVTAELRLAVAEARLSETEFRRRLERIEARAALSHRGGGPMAPMGLAML